MLDPLGVVTKTRGAEEEEESLAEAPSTITNREEASRPARENIFYMPQAQAVPEIAVPEFLPDLVGECILKINILIANELTKYRAVVSH